MTGSQVAEHQHDSCDSFHLVSVFVRLKSAVNLRMDLCICVEPLPYIPSGLLCFYTVEPSVRTMCLMTAKSGSAGCLRKKENFFTVAFHLTTMPSSFDGFCRVELPIPEQVKGGDL